MIDLPLYLCVFVCLCVIAVKFAVWLWEDKSKPQSHHPIIESHDNGSVYVNGTRVGNSLSRENIQDAIKAAYQVGYTEGQEAVRRDFRNLIAKKD